MPCHKPLRRGGQVNWCSRRPRCFGILHLVAPCTSWPFAPTVARCYVCAPLQAVAIAACGRNQRLHVGASSRPARAAGYFIAGASSAARAWRTWHRGESQAPADLARAAKIRSTCSPRGRGGPNA